MKGKVMTTTTSSISIRECIGRCQSCVQECLRCMNHCLNMGGDHAAYDHQCVMQDCADICQTTARYLCRESPRIEQACTVCAQICHHCAVSCSRLSEDDDQMDACVRSCNACEEACREIAASCK